MTGGLENLRRKMNPVSEGRVLLGVSGGADSICMLALLGGEGAPNGVTAEAVHVNHGLRGAESDEDEIFVRGMCEKIGVTLHVYRADLKGRKDENAARKARFACFRACMEENGISTLALAHHADDLAETFMMRLLRGAGPEGLGCMKAEDELDGIRIIRPMLQMRRDEIRTALREAGISWREDSSNGNTAYLRNCIRKRLIPLMEEMNPGAAGRIAETARQISADNEAAEKQTNRFLAEHAGKRWIDFRALAQMPDGTQRRILRKWWQDNAPMMEEHALNAEQTKRLADLIRAEHGKINLPGGLHAEKGKQALHLTGFPRETLPEIPALPGKTVFSNCSLVTLPGEGNPGDGKREQEVPDGWLEGCMIRTRRNGDRITPFGMKGSRKLQDYLTDRGIDAAWRDEIPLLCRENEVMMVAGVGTGGVPEWTGKSGNIRLRWEGRMPWAGDG